MRTRALLPLFAIVLAVAGCDAGSSAKRVATAPMRWFGDKEKDPHEKAKSDRDKVNAKDAKDAAEASANSPYQKAQRLTEAGEYKKAIPLWEKIVEEQPRNDEALRYLGDCKYNIEQFDEAVDCYKRARKLNPNNYLALRDWGFTELNAGHAVLKEGKPDAAMERYAESLRLLREANKVFAGDSDAVYGRALAANGASQLVAAQARQLKERNDDIREAEKRRDQCLDLCSEGIEAASFRINRKVNEPGPRALVANLFKRRADLLYAFGRLPEAIDAAQLSQRSWQSIVKEIDKNEKGAAQFHEKAKQELASIEITLRDWRAKNAGAVSQ